MHSAVLLWCILWFDKPQDMMAKLNSLPPARSQEAKVIAAATGGSYTTSDYAIIYRAEKCEAR